MKSISVTMPAYNEEQNIQGMVEEVMQAMPKPSFKVTVEK